MTRGGLTTGLVVLLLTGCGGSRVEQAGGPPSDDDSEVAIRFVIEVTSGRAPLFVTPFDESAQPGWVVPFRDGERIYLRARCEIEDCGQPPAVCGAALPTVLDLDRQAARSIDIEWDGTTSVVDSASGCERRVRAPTGGYVARFCYSDEADVEPGADRDEAMAGTLVNRECTDVPFELGDSVVVLRL